MTDQTHQYTLGCGCLACAETRAWLRSIGRHQQRAVDWRGEPLKAADECEPLVRVDLGRRAS